MTLIMIMTGRSRRRRRTAPGPRHPPRPHGRQQKTRLCNLAAASNQSPVLGHSGELGPGQLYMVTLVGSVSDIGQQHRVIW